MAISAQSTTHTLSSSISTIFTKYLCYAHTSIVQFGSLKPSDQSTLTEAPVGMFYTHPLTFTPFQLWFQ